jgi:hypothetical protein
MVLGRMHSANRLEKREHLGVTPRGDGVGDHRDQCLFVGLVARRRPERTGREVLAAPGSTELERTAPEGPREGRIMQEIAVRFWI